MTLLTWLAIVVLGPGALLVFLWFLRDLPHLLDDAETGPVKPPDGEG